MTWWKSNKITKWLRILHRDLGFLMVGVCLVYGVSGILLNHMKGKDPAFKTIEAEVKAPAGLSNEELMTFWADHQELPTLKKIFPIDDDFSRLMLAGGVGVYNSVTGQIDYEMHKRNALIYWIDKLHYNQIKGWSIMADFFAVSLIFFAVSGLFIVKGKNGLAGSGKWYLIVGLLIPVLYVMLA
ncbi:MAG: PepSY-associated TM helix domain-containing protein [Massilibacteroides sp.]|nr:PepSY-associated TM helix domain-containing protein [Massilibacteroides sp.]MDD3062145.1 PepSY-associated TM helix domain-containing protein [Massilibacteroides sp.]MDD4115029.1 PepSY-associated TM helix domain-containing protein [Massilibacteroides sp.]MDD4660294.1 PepSY-associated TM helix domain-containing protein [Massilibacteroides sp.]